MVVIYSSAPALSLMWSYPWGPRPDMRSDQSVPSVTARHRAHLPAAVAISRDLGRAVSLVEARDCHVLPSISPFWSSPHDTPARVHPLMSPTGLQQPLHAVRAACCLPSPSSDSIAHSHLLFSVHRNVPLFMFLLWSSITFLPSHYLLSFYLPLSNQ